MIITSILLWKKKPTGQLFAGPLLIFSILAGVGILFSNALIRLWRTSVSYVPDAVVGTIVALSIALAWLFLREVKKKPSEQEEWKQDICSKQSKDTDGHISPA
jgi:flagellar biosynthesis protein FliQ